MTAYITKINNASSTRRAPGYCLHWRLQRQAMNVFSSGIATRLRP